MRRGLEWYKREPRAFLEGVRAARMTERQIAVYSIVLDLIYDGGGETPDDPKHIASFLADVGQAAVRATIAQLVDLGKIYRVGDMLHQKRAENEAKTREKLTETRAFTGRLGGVSSGFSRRRANENNEISEANASSKREAEKEKRREELSEAKASDENPDFAKQLWDRGVAFLERNGTPNRQAKAMIGKWRKFYQDTDIFDAFAACSKQGVVDPIPWIAARLNGRDKGDGKSTRSETRLRAFLAGAAVAPGMGSGEDCDTSQPLLARR